MPTKGTLSTAMASSKQSLLYANITIDHTTLQLLPEDGVPDGLKQSL
jgi:hypothetical protein